MSNVIRPNMYPTLVAGSISDMAREIGADVTSRNSRNAAWSTVRFGLIALHVYAARNGARVALLTVGPYEFTLRLRGAK